MRTGLEEQADYRMQNQAQPRPEGFGHNGVRRKVLILKLPQAKLLAVDASRQDRRRAFAESGSANRDRPSKRLRGSDGGHGPNPTLVTDSGASEVQEPLVSLASDQPVLEERKGYRTRLGEDGRDLMNPETHPPRSWRVRPGPSENDIPHSVNMQPQGNSVDSSCNYLDNGEYEEAKDLTLLNTSRYIQHAQSFNGPPRQPEAFPPSTKTHSTTPSADRAAEYQPMDMIPPGIQELQNQVSASPPPNRAYMGRQDLLATVTNITGEESEDQDMRDQTESTSGQPYVPQKSTPLDGRDIPAIELNTMGDDTRNTILTDQNGSGSRHPTEAENSTPSDIPQFNKEPHTAGASTIDRPNPAHEKQNSTGEKLRGPYENTQSSLAPSTNHISLAKEVPIAAEIASPALRRARTLPPEPQSMLRNSPARVDADKSSPGHRGMYESIAVQTSEAGTLGNAVNAGLHMSESPLLGMVSNPESGDPYIAVSDQHQALPVTSTPQQRQREEDTTPHTEPTLPRPENTQDVSFGTASGIDTTTTSTGPTIVTTKSAASKKTSTDVNSRGRFQIWILAKRFPLEERKRWSVPFREQSVSTVFDKATEVSHIKIFDTMMLELETKKQKWIWQVHRNQDAAFDKSKQEIVDTVKEVRKGTRNAGQDFKLLIKPVTNEHADPLLESDSLSEEDGDMDWF